MNKALFLPVAVAGLLAFWLIIAKAAGQEAKAPGKVEPRGNKKEFPPRFSTLDRADAGPDFALQGEYRGEIAGKDKATRVLCAQVGALGGGAFRAAFHFGGFPGEMGWKSTRPAAERKGRPRLLADMNLEIYGRFRDGRVVFDCCPGKYVEATLLDGVLEGRNENGPLKMTRRGTGAGPAGDYSGTFAVSNKGATPGQARITAAGPGPDVWRMVVSEGETTEALNAAEAEITDVLTRVEGVELYGWREGEEVNFPVAPGKRWTARLAGGEMRGTTEGGEGFTLRRVERRSSTVGARPPEGAVVLFDGTSAAAWESEGSPIKQPVVELAGEKVLASGLKTRQLFKGFTLHIEWITAFQPYARKWYRGNSGVFLQGRFEATVGDSFGWRVDGEPWAAGGIFLTRAPAANAALPPLTWQTFDIELAPPDGPKGKTVISVRHNGVLTVDKAELTGGTAHAILKDASNGGPIYLERPQGDIVFYRNVWIVPR